MLNLPTTIFCPVMEEFLAISINACAVSSRFVCRHNKLVTTYTFNPQRTSNHNTKERKGTKGEKNPTVFFNHALSSNALTLSSPYNWPHSVKSNPGSTALTRTLGACVQAKHFIKCSCAAFVTLYGMLEPLGLMPAMEDVMMKAPPSVLASKVARAARMRCIWARTLTA
jgi:hypothetical protein